MEYLILAIILWGSVFFLIPTERVKELSGVAIIAFIWGAIVDNISIGLGFYKYTHTLIPIGNASLFQNLSMAGMGIIMVNWLNKKLFSKAISVLAVSIGLSFVEYIFIQRNAFTYGSLNMLSSFILDVVALSIFIWLCLLIVGEEKIYFGNKSRLKANQIV